MTGNTIDPRGAHTRPNRRSFLKGAGAVAGAGALTPLLPGLARAQRPSVVAVMPGVFLPDAARPIAQEQSGARIENAPYVSPTDTLAKLMAPGGTSRYDLMISLTQFVKGTALGAHQGDERVLALDLDLIPNANNLMPMFAKEVVTRGGNTYMIPIVWGYDSVIYNADHVPTDAPETQSWGLLFNDGYAGRIAWRDDAHGMIMTAGLHMGIEDPVNMPDSDLNEVQAFLISKKPLVRTMWSAFGEAVNLMSSGEVWAMYGWIAMRAALQKQGLNVTNNWPSDGLLTWNQAGFVPKDAPNAEAAQRVINAMLSKEFGTVLTRVTNYPSTSQEVVSEFSPEEQRKLGLDLAERDLAVYNMSFPPSMDRWIEVWNTVKSA